MDPSAARSMAMNLMSEHGVLERGWRFRFNRRTRSLGLCNYTDRRIELSTHFVAMNDEAAVRDTVLHEIAHAVAGRRAGHGPKWAAACRRLGATPAATCNSSAMPRGMYQACCGGCGEQYDRFRRVKRGWRYYCPKCGPERGRLRFMRRVTPTPDAVPDRRNPTPSDRQLSLW